MIYKVDDEGVLALNTMAARASDTVETIDGLISAINSVTDQHHDVIGPHEEALEEAISDISNCVKSASEPVNEAVGKLQRVAGRYQEIINRKRFGRKGR